MSLCQCGTDGPVSPHASLCDGHDASQESLRSCILQGHWAALAHRLVRGARTTQYRVARGCRRVAQSARPLVCHWAPPRPSCARTPCRTPHSCSPRRGGRRWSQRACFPERASGRGATRRWDVQALRWLSISPTMALFHSSLTRRSLGSRTGASHRVLVCLCGWLCRARCRHGSRCDCRAPSTGS